VAIRRWMGASNPLTDDESSEYFMWRQLRAYCPEIGFVVIKLSCTKWLFF